MRPYILAEANWDALRDAKKLTYIQQAQEENKAYLADQEKTINESIDLEKKDLQMKKYSAKNETEYERLQIQERIKLAQLDFNKSKQIQL